MGVFIALDHNGPARLRICEQKIGSKRRPGHDSIVLEVASGVAGEKVSGG